MEEGCDVVYAHELSSRRMFYWPGMWVLIGVSWWREKIPYPAMVDSFDLYTELFVYMLWRGGHFRGSSVEKCGSGGEWGMGGGGRGEG